MHRWSISTGHGGRFSNIDRSVRARIAEVPRTPADGLLADVARSARLRVAPTQPRSCRAMAGRRARLQAVRGELRGGRAADASRAGVRAYILPPLFIATYQYMLLRRKGNLVPLLPE